METVRNDDIVGTPEHADMPTAALLGRVEARARVEHKSSELDTTLSILSHTTPVMLEGQRQIILT